MAVDVCFTSEVSISPRISFSHDLHDQSPDINSIQPDPTYPVRSDQFLLSPSFDFDFCATSNLTPADELFSNGKILPTQIKKPPKIIQHPEPETEIQVSDNPNTDTQKKRLKEFIFRSEEDQDQEKSTSRPFWQFRRSASLNCDNGKGPKGLLRSLSLKSLSRSNSTGSALNPKRNVAPKVIEKSKEAVILRRCSSLTQPPPSTHVYYTYNNPNNCKGGIRIIPVLNVPPAYNISKGTLNFFGFGSIFCNGKTKKKTK